MATSGILIGARSFEDPDSTEGEYALHYVSSGVKVSMVLKKVSQGQVGVIKPMGETWIEVKE